MTATTVAAGNGELAPGPRGGRPAGLTPLDAARRRGAEELVAWLRDRGASSAAELHAT